MRIKGIMRFLLMGVTTDNGGEAEAGRGKRRECLARGKRKKASLSFSSVVKWGPGKGFTESLQNS